MLKLKIWNSGDPRHRQIDNRSGKDNTPEEESPGFFLSLRRDRPADLLPPVRMMYQEGSRERRLWGW